MVAHPIRAPEVSLSAAVPRRRPSGALLRPAHSSVQTPRAWSGGDSAWDQLKALLGYSGGDPGSWNFSPEWYGTQGGGWGHDQGQVVFARDSPFNGRVEVTAHAASELGFDSSGGAGGDGSALRQEWRVLRFNGVTRQSVARVRIADGADLAAETRGLQQQRWWLERGQSVAAVPECLAQEYLKSMTSLMAALLGLHCLLPDMPSSALAGGGEAPRALRVLCIGLGGGSLPNFLVHHFPFADIDAVEIDPAVVEAATLAMGLPAQQPRLALHTADAMDFVEARSGAGVEPYDVVCMDAFTGDDEVPSTLCTPRFAAALARAMHPAHGTLLINFHSLAIRPIAAVFKEALWGGDGDDGGIVASGACGSCFSVATAKQQNVTLVCSRGLELPPASGDAKERLKLAAAYVGDSHGFLFPAGARACRNLQSC